MKQFEKLAGYCHKNNIEYNDVTETLFERFCEMLIEKNKVMNLTAVTEPEEIEVKHFIDSVSSVSEIRELFPYTMPNNTIKVVDIGTGAGFPGLPLAIVLPEIQFTLADSLNKRIEFLKEVKHELKIDNVFPIQTRAEDLGQGETRESYDLCVSRAVADMSVLLEYCLPLVKKDGYTILYKSGDYQEELRNAEYAMKILGGEVKTIREFNLPDTDIRRSIIVIKKSTNTPEKYPRRAGKPSKLPLTNK